VNKLEQARRDAPRSAARICQPTSHSRLHPAPLRAMNEKHPCPCPSCYSAVEGCSIVIVTATPSHSSERTTTQAATAQEAASKQTPTRARKPTHKRLPTIQSRNRHTAETGFDAPFLRSPPNALNLSVLFGGAGFVLRLISSPSSSRRRFRLVLILRGARFRKPGSGVEAQDRHRQCPDAPAQLLRPKVDRGLRSWNAC